MKKRRSVFIVFLSLVAVFVVLSPTIQAFQGGVQSGNEEYCGSDCHKVQSSALMTMWASNLTPAAGSSVTVIVNVTGGTTSQILGVMLVSTLSAVPDSLPSAHGWAITSDPSGTTTKYNWYETTSYSGQASMQWTLNAPSTAGLYKLFARLLHGGADTFALDNKTGLPFAIGTSSQTGIPTVIVTSPTDGEEVSGSISVTANVDSEQSIQYVSLKMDGVEIGNKTNGPYFWDIDTATYLDGSHVINVTAADVDGDRGSNEIEVTVNNAEESTTLLGWVWTMASGSLAIVAAMSVLIVLVLMVRKKKVEGRLR